MSSRFAIVWRAAFSALGKFLEYLYRLIQNVARWRDRMTMKTMSFEIKVPILGYVSAGKSTVLNALLQAKYSEVAMRRTTAGVNFFRLFTKEDVGNTSASKARETSWSLDPENLHSPEQALKSITRDNAELRKKNIVHESTFDIELDEPLCDMRADTNLVLIDIPGLNEAGSKNIYREYVSENWHTYDCVIAVMDVFQGVNTEEQVQLLELINRNVNERRSVPVIVLCNKVDDLGNNDVLSLVREVKSKVEEIFEKSCYCANRKSKGANLELSFFPIAAESAFVYRTAARLSFDDFKMLDKDLIEKLGREEVGKSKWRSLSQAQKYEAAYKCVSTESTYEGSPEAESFRKFIFTLNMIIGGNDSQLALIGKQFDIAMRSLSSDKHIANQLRIMYDAQKHLGTLMDEEYYINQFNTAFETFHQDALYDFKYEMDHLSLQEAMIQLIEYDSFLKYIGCDIGKRTENIKRMAHLVRAQVQEIVTHTDVRERFSDLIHQSIYDWDQALRCWKKFAEGSYVACQGEKNISKPPADCRHHWEYDGNVWRNKYTHVEKHVKYNPAAGAPSWCILTPHDMFIISQSILTLSFSKTFCQYFGNERMLLEGIVHNYKFMVNTTYMSYHSILSDQRHPCSTPAHVELAYAFLCKYREGTYDTNGKFVPSYPDRYKLITQIEMPEQLSDPEHWGHLAWLFCEFMDTCKEKEN